jgi:hypothetical protein
MEEWAMIKDVVFCNALMFDKSGVKCKEIMGSDSGP